MSTLRSAAGLRGLCVALLAAVVLASFVVFGDLSLIPIRLHALAFVVMPFVMWGGIQFGVAGASLSVFVIATIATILTALGSGPFSLNTPFVNAALLDVLFAVLAVSGLALGAVIAEREHAEDEREHLVREQVEAEARLKLAAIVEASDDSIVSESLDGRVLSWNRAAMRMFGVDEARAIGQPVAAVVPVELCGYEKAIVQAFTDGADVLRFEGERTGTDGSKTYLSTVVSPLRDVSGELIGISRTIRDVSEQKRAEEVLSVVNRRLIEAQEQERARIARELHDDISQQLAVLAWSLTGQPDELRAQAADIVASVQALSRELHPSRIELIGLAAGLEAFCSEFGAKKSVTIAFESAVVPTHFPADVSLALFRVAQEALHNAVKHSGVTHFSVRLWMTHRWLHLMVEEAGAGFDVHEAKKSARGIGLVTMAERIKLIGGQLAIESGRSGTRVHARAPLTPPLATA